jgi:MCM P-loop domain
MAQRRDRNERYIEEIERLLRDIQQMPVPDATPAQVRYSHQDLLYSIRELARHEQLSREQLQHLQSKIRDYLDYFVRRGEISWDTVEYHKIVDLRDPLMEWEAVKIRALLEKMTEPVAVVDKEGDKHLTAQMTFLELDGPDGIDSVPTINTPLIRQIDTLKSEYHVYDVLATVLLLPTPHGERFYVLVHDMVPSLEPLQLVRATQAEIAEAKATLAELQARDQNVFEYLLTTLVQGLHIRGLEDASELRDSLEAVIVQAFSDGWINNAAGKLHTLIIGAPAVGKKLLVDAARVLNPVFQEAQPHKVTVAGVSSTAGKKNGIWRSDPGFLPIAHRGVFAIQDFHSVERAMRVRLLGTFNMVMEDGRVIDSTASRQTHPALTSIHLDMNKRTDLFPGSPLQGETIVAQRLDDIRIPMTSLSRFDYIIDIPRDPQRQMDVALAMFDGVGQNAAPQSVGRALAPWARKLQVLAAFLRSSNADITFTPEIKAQMQQKYKELNDSNEQMIHQLPWLSDFQARLVNSIFKFAAAYARMNNRPSPIPEDIDRVFRLIWRKFDFLSTLSRHLRIPTSWEVPQQLDLDNWLKEKFIGRCVEPKEILAAYEEEFSHPLIRKTLERHLPNVAQRVTKGVWQFPPSSSI